MPGMADITTAAELDAMTPAERHEHFLASQVTDLSSLPPAYQERLAAQAERLAAREHRQAS